MLHTTIDPKTGMSRNQSFMNNNSRNSSGKRTGDCLKNYRSMSNLRPSTGQSKAIHNTSVSKPMTTGIGLNIGSIAHNRSYGRM